MSTTLPDNCFEFKLFFWNGRFSRRSIPENKGKFCLALTVNNSYFYLDSSLQLQNVAVNCWYTPDEICEILKKLNETTVCQHCNTRHL